jgi:hydrogenase expression/formation protein HypE
MAEETKGNESFGKAPREFFEDVIFPQLGATRPEVLIGPSAGVDTSVIRINENQVLISTTDPISLIPELGATDSAWMSVNLLANDLTTSSFRPQYLTIDFNLSPVISEKTFAEYWDALSKECARLGIAIVGGHTGKFDGIDSTVVGSGVLFSTGSAPYLTTKNAKLGDKLILTKGAAISSTGLLAKIFPTKVRDAIGDSLYERASLHFAKISAMEDALTAASVGVGMGGVTAMHDVTEGGVVSALCELANASSLGLRVDTSRIPISEETKAVCTLFDLDPLVSLGEGALVISCNPSKADEVIGALEQRGTNATVVGELVQSLDGLKFKNDSGEVEYSLPIKDPYWEAYYAHSRHSNSKVRNK